MWISVLDHMVLHKSIFSHIFSYFSMKIWYSLRSCGPFWLETNTYVVMEKQEHSKYFLFVNEPFRALDQFLL